MAYLEAFALYSGAHMVYNTNQASRVDITT